MEELAVWETSSVCKACY